MSGHLLGISRFVIECGLARLVAELPSPPAQLTTSAGGLAAPASSQDQKRQQQQGQRGGGGEDDDGIVNAVTGLSMGDAVRLKLVRKRKPVSSEPLVVVAC